MNTTVAILLVLLVVYVPLWAWIFKSPKAKAMGLEIWGPAVKINTKLGLRVMDRLAVYRRFWNAFGTFSQIVSFILMAAMVFIIAMAVYRLPTTLSASNGIGIEYALALPGLNPIMPFWYTLLALIIALVCHEMAHGFQTRANGMGVIHTGLLHMVVPLGAFVEPVEEDVKKASRKARIHLYAAGITTNFIIGMVSFLVLSAGLMGGLSSQYSDNAGVYSNLDSDGIPVGAMITVVDGQEFRYADILNPVTTLIWHLDQKVVVVYDTQETKSLQKGVQWGVRIAAVVSGSAAESSGIEKGDTVTFIELGGTTYYLYSHIAFSRLMEGTAAGQSVVVGYYDVSDGSYKTATVVLGDNAGKGFLGISTNTAGMMLVTPDQVLQLGMNPFYGASALPEYAIGLVSYLSHPFSGFTPIASAFQWWYQTSFSGFWELAQTLYWLFWLNILLGVTNAIPAMPFDGGYVLREWIDGILERMGKNDPVMRKRQTDEIASNVSSVFLILLLVMIASAVL